MSDLDNLLDMTLDDIDDLPEFKSFPAGAYNLDVTLESKKVGDHPCVEMSLKLLEVVQLVSPTDTPPKEGDTSSILFMLDNKFGLGKLKAAVTPIAVALGVSSIREAAEQCKGMNCIAVLTVRQDKNDADKEYQGVKELQVV